MLQYMPLLYHGVSILPIGMGIDTSSGSLSNDMIVFNADGNSKSLVLL